MQLGKERATGFADDQAAAPAAGAGLPQDEPGTRETGQPQAPEPEPAAAG